MKKERQNKVENLRLLLQSHFAFCCCSPVFISSELGSEQSKDSSGFSRSEVCARAADLGSFILMSKIAQPVQLRQDFFPEIWPVFLP